MVAVLRIILIIVIAWYLIRFIDRYIVPALFGNPGKKKSSPEPDGKKFKKSTRQGDVTITDFGNRGRKNDPPDDDYVDYEEVK
jgi:hypothetical protein